jgi:hypothetical protein
MNLKILQTSRIHKVKRQKANLMAAKKQRQQHQIHGTLSGAIHPPAEFNNVNAALQRLRLSK